MLRVTTLYAATASATALYYTRYLTQADGEEPGIWTGRQAAGLGLGLAHRDVFVEGAAGARRQQQRVLLDVFLALMLGPRQRLARPPVIADLVVVPLAEQARTFLSSRL